MVCELYKRLLSYMERGSDSALVLVAVVVSE